MAARRYWWLVIAALALAACRTTAPAGRSAPKKPEASAPVAPPAAAGRPPAPVAPDLVEDRTPPAMITGFDLGGAASCLALPGGVRCLARKDAVTDGCAAVKGQALPCEDCSVLCSKELKGRR